MFLNCTQMFGRVPHLNCMFSLAHECTMLRNYSKDVLDFIFMEIIKWLMQGTSCSL